MRKKERREGKTSKNTPPSIPAYAPDGASRILTLLPGVALAWGLCIGFTGGFRPVYGFKLPLPSS